MTECLQAHHTMNGVVYAGMNLPADFNFTQAVHAADERIPVAAPLWELASIEKNNK